MKASIRLPLLMLIAGCGLPPVAIAQVADPAGVSDPAAPPVISADLPADDGYPPKPDGVPADVHRKVVQLYERLHTAYPDASRQRIFSQIADELGIAPERLWTAYHDQGTDRTPPRIAPPLTDTGSLSRADKLTARRPGLPVVEAARPSVRIERVQRAERPVRFERVRPAERPQRGR